MLYTVTTVKDPIYMGPPQDEVEIRMSRDGYACFGGKWNSYSVQRVVIANGGKHTTMLRVSGSGLKGLV